MMTALMVILILIGIGLIAIGLFIFIMAIASMVASIRYSRDATRFYKRIQYNMKNPASRDEYERVMSNYLKATQKSEDNN